MTTGCPPSSRQRQCLRWINSHAPHAGSWIEKPGYFMLRSKRGAISIAEQDWAAIRRYIAHCPAPSVLFGLNPDGLAVIASET